MKIKDRPEYRTKPKPLSCSPDTSISEASKLMSEQNYGAIVITSPDNSVLGLVTERDLMRRVLAQSRDPETTTVADIMTKDVRVANAEDDLYEWLRIMSNERFRRLPVVDADGKLHSIMTQGDFVSYTWPELMNQASTLTRSLVSSKYQVFLILGGILLYTLLVLLVGAFG